MIILHRPDLDKPFEAVNIERITYMCVGSSVTGSYDVYIETGADAAYSIGNFDTDDEAEAALIYIARCFVNDLRLVKIGAREAPQR